MLRGVATVAETNIRDGKGRPLVGQPKSICQPSQHRDSRRPGGRTGRAHGGQRPSQQRTRTGCSFASPEGGLLRYSNWRNRVWLPAVRAAGCDGAGFHDLRRANATQLVAGVGRCEKPRRAVLATPTPASPSAFTPKWWVRWDRRAAETIGDVFLGSWHAHRGWTLTNGGSRQAP